MRIRLPGEAFEELSLKPVRLALFLLENCIRLLSLVLEMTA